MGLGFRAGAWSLVGCEGFAGLHGHFGVVTSMHITVLP